MIGSARKINRKYLLTPKVLYFLVNLQYYTLHQFRGVFAKKKFGASDGDLAYFIGPMLGTVFFTNILIGAMNDKYGRSHLFIISALLLTFLFLQLFFVEAYMTMVPGMSIFWFNLFLYMAFNNGIPPLLDKAVLDYLNEIPEAGAREFAKQKLWGTAGYGVSCKVIEMCIKFGEEFKFGNLRYYSLVTTILSASAVFLLLRSPAREGTSTRSDILANCKELLRNGSYLFFIFIILLNGITRQALSIYHVVYLTEILQIKGYELPASWPSWLQYLVGFFNESPVATATFCGMAFEVVMLYHFPKISQKIGLVWPFFIAQLFQILRVICYFMLDYNNPHVFMYCCLIELTRGVYFGLLTPSAVQLAMNLCPPHLKATSQMIYHGTFTALGSLAASAVFGSLFSEAKMKGADISLEEKASNYKVFFLVNIAFACATVALFSYKYFFLDRISRRNAEVEKKELNGRQSIAESQQKNTIVSK
ncbi:MFS1-like protein [Ordospora pajunii]|uniref:MFS1-like protein n=1 Tax=Ordospora pajunii TaxID=3039483 RepID=UPI00295262A2|nr:MFS1-like protein [Ordospora pajunii]KAH9410717.1 MFS1-like protein [Ordospora pajunii]